MLRSTRSTVFLTVLALALTLVLVPAQSLQAEANTYGTQNGVKTTTTTDMKVLADHVFNQLKGLQGNWIGTFPDFKSSPPFQVTYRIIGGGSVVEEIFRPGLASETQTNYIRTQTSVRASHICRYGTQPVMDLVGASADGTEFLFAAAGGTNLDYQGDKTRTMILDSLQFPADGTVIAVWSTFEGNRLLGTPTKVLLTRQ
ncbi:MAG: hypothetical protein AAGD01_17005 [Acidobacteriota bacterium]